MINHKESQLRTDERVTKYSKIGCFKVTVRGTLSPQYFMKSRYNLTEEERHELDMMERWHFLMNQQGWYTFAILFISSVEIFIFFIAWIGSDETKKLEGLGF